MPRTHSTRLVGRWDSPYSADTAVGENGYPDVRDVGVRFRGHVETMHLVGTELGAGQQLCPVTKQVALVFVKTECWLTRNVGFARFNLHGCAQRKARIRKEKCCRI